jgi:hypothetical protein
MVLYCFGTLFRDTVMGHCFGDTESHVLLEVLPMKASESSMPTR